MAETLAETKKDLRKAAKQRRAACAREAPDAGRRVAAQVLREIPLPHNVPVSGYWPMGDELDVAPLLAELSARGHTVGLPVMLGAGQPLAFREWRPGDELAEAGFGTREPRTDKAEILPQVLFVPLLAFDRAGYRLGYGGGFYDRTLEKLAAGDGGATAIGVGYAGQEVEEIPRDRYDWRLDWIVTEREVLRFQAN